MSAQNIVIKVVRYASLAISIISFIYVIYSFHMMKKAEMRHNAKVKLSRDNTELKDIDTIDNF
jgi:hypothetical protein